VRALYLTLLRPLLFLLDAETAHHFAAFFLRALQRFAGLRGLFVGLPPARSLTVHALGRTFASPVGMAAGFDKSAELYNALGALGFGAVEVGTVTAQPQPGNPRPRLFRLRADGAIVNRMGFNNPGAAAVAAAVKAHPPEGVVLGINLGKTKVVELEHAAEDYAASARQLGPLAHYVVINVSSPNTPGLRSLQSVETLRPIIAAVQKELSALPTPPPLLVKIAPDLADEDIDAVADLALEMKLAGLIATNTTIAREGLGLHTTPEQIAQIGAGGLSGAPLRPRALAVIRRLYARTRGALTIVGVGGIANADHAWEAIRAGATLVQVYSAFAYHGPTLARDITTGLAERLAASGYARLTDAVGADVRGESAAHG
jgi:dihydroorotate dehydrogenase